VVEEERARCEHERPIWRAVGRACAGQSAPCMGAGPVVLIVESSRLCVRECAS